MLYGDYIGIISPYSLLSTRKCLAVEYVEISAETIFSKLHRLLNLLVVSDLIGVFSGLSFFQ